jgi:hypothetical protein
MTDDTNAPGPVDRGGLLFNDVWFPAPSGRDQREGWDIRLTELAELAQPEMWDDPHEPTGRLPVLGNYLRYTYARLLEEDGGSKFVEAVDERGTRFAAFNTGLFTAHFEPIICLMQEHRDPARDNWVFQAWVTPTDWRLRGIEHDRLRPAYFFEDPSEILLNPSFEIEPNVNHVLDRLTERTAEELPADVVQRRIMLTGAADEARKRVQMNWRLAVPQFYWPKGIHRGRIQLLLPLRLHANHAADLALVVEREGNRYVGYTILTVSMAYKNARLLSRPESDWLWIPPMSLPEAEEIDDDAAPKWRRVSGGDRCPICSEPTECVLNADNRTAMCARIEEGGKPTKTKTGGMFWEHSWQR